MCILEKQVVHTCYTNSRPPFMWMRHLYQAKKIQCWCQRVKKWPLTLYSCIKISTSSHSFTRSWLTEATMLSYKWSEMQIFVRYYLPPYIKCHRYSATCGKDLSPRNHFKASVSSDQNSVGDTATETNHRYILKGILPVPV